MIFFVIIYDLHFLIVFKKSIFCKVQATFLLLKIKGGEARSVIISNRPFRFSKFKKICIGYDLKSSFSLLKNLRIATSIYQLADNCAALRKQRTDLSHLSRKLLIGLDLNGNEGVRMRNEIVTATALKDA